jgi:hypothetical protein
MLNPLPLIANPARGSAPRRAAISGTSAVLATEPPAALRDDTQRLGGVLEQYAWLAHYEADAFPYDETPAWTETLEAPVSASVSGGVLSVANVAGNAAWRFWELAVPSLDNAVGTYLSARIRVTADGAGVNQGAVLCLCDGVYQFAVWLRADGVNLDGEADFPFDMTSYRKVVLAARGTSCWLSVDGLALQNSVWMNATAQKKLVFGTWTLL